LWQEREPLLVEEVKTTESHDKLDDVAVEKAEDVAAMEGKEGEVGKRMPLIGEEHTIVEALRTADFWVLFISFLCGVGTGLAVMNNMGQIGLALGYADVSIFVSLTSIWGFFGRIISGTVSEYFIK
jgi:hypothetical protein